MAKEKISFYDVKSKKKFLTDKYKIVNKKGRYFAVTPSRTGSYNCWRVISKVTANANK